MRIGLTGKQGGDTEPSLGLPPFCVHMHEVSSRRYRLEREQTLGKGLMNLTTRNNRLAAPSFQCTT